MSRTIAIGDIHGCSIALAALVEAIDLQPTDTLIPLGDFVDRGSDSKGVLDQLIGLRESCNLIPILGNHDQMMLHARNSKSDFQFWMNCGGDAALDSYGSSSRLDLIPPQHFQFLEGCHSFYETDSHLFLHANFAPATPLMETADHTLRWLSLRDSIPQSIHCSGKIAFVGHTPQAEILSLGFLVCLDTGVCDGGWLSAMDIDSGKVWQVNERGELRRV